MDALQGTLISFLTCSFFVEKVIFVHEVEIFFLEMETSSALLQIHALGEIFLLGATNLYPLLVLTSQEIDVWDFVFS